MIQDTLFESIGILKIKRKKVFYESVRKIVNMAYMILDSHGSALIMVLMNGEYLHPLPTKTLGAFLRERRRQEGFSIRKLADAIKQISADDEEVSVSSAYICDVENGRRVPSDSILSRLVQALNISDEELEIYDSRVPNQEIQELSQMNALYGVAFRRMVKHIRKHDVSPEEIIETMISKFAR